MKSELSTPILQKESIVTHREYLMLAVPLIISGISTPILGAVDTAVVGRMPDPSAIGAVSVGAVTFNTMYWLLGFLRVSTTGLTSQANGANDITETLLSLFRPMFIAISIGLLFILLQVPILLASLNLFGTTQDLEALVSTYFSIRIWGAPFALLNYVMIGWLMGMGRVKLSLSTQLFMNLLNIVLDLLFVLVFDLGVAGVAYATVISEVSAIFFGFWCIFHTKQIKLSFIKREMILKKAPFVKMVKLNRDLFLRSICLLTMTVTFTTLGARMGEITLAANSILLQIHYLMAYLIAGFANASSILVGRSVGSHQLPLFKRAIHLSFLWGLGSATLLSLGMLLFGEWFISIFTTILEVKAVTIELMVWMVVYPLVGFWGLQLEGIFSGATEAQYIRNSIFVALIVFMTTIFLFDNHMNQHLLWISFNVFTLGRSLFLSLSLKRLRNLKFG